MSPRRGERGRRTLGQRLVLAVNGALVVALLATAGGLAYVYGKYSQLPRVRIGSVLSEPTSADEPRNFLLVGVDSAATLDPDDPARAGRDEIGGLRSDTMMVLRVDPRTAEASLLSLPRDLWVPLAAGGNQRINTAIQTGGPVELIDTIEQYFGIPINHYIQVDFAGFQGLVEVVNGVEVYFAHPARDTRSGLDVPEAGCVALDGAQALSYVRSRHFQSFEDGRWRTDPSADLGRISRQQDFIVRALRRSVQQGVRNPVTLDRLVDAALETVTVDDLLTADDIVSLARAFRGFDPGALDTYSLPVTPDLVGGAEILRLQDERAQPILDLFRGTEPGELRPEDVRVRVLNGSGLAGQASDTAGALAAVGFPLAGTGEAERFDLAQTTVRHGPGGEAKAVLVARHLDPEPRLELVDADLGADVVVVTGQAQAGVLTIPRDSGPRSTLPTSSTTTTTAPGALPTVTTSSTSTTSTTVVGFVPEPPPGVSC